MVQFHLVENKTHRSGGSIPTDGVVSYSTLMLVGIHHLLGEIQGEPCPFDPQAFHQETLTIS